MKPETKERLKDMGYVQTIAGLYRLAKGTKKAKSEIKTPKPSEVHNESAEPIVKTEAKRSVKKTKRYRSRKDKA